MGLIRANHASPGAMDTIRLSSGRPEAATDPQASPCINHDRPATPHTRAQAARGTMRSHQAENPCRFGTHARRRDPNHASQPQSMRQFNGRLRSEATIPNRHRTLKGCQAGRRGAGREGVNSRALGRYLWRSSAPSVHRC